MPKTTTIPSREQIEQQAGELAAKLDAFREQDQQQAAEDHRRKVEAQREWDEQLVAGYNRTAIDAEAEQAKAAFDQALAANPLVLALADYAAAMRRRSHRLHEYMAARGRLGLPTAPPDVVVTDLAHLDEYVTRTAERIAGDLIGAENADLHAGRDAAGDTPKENR